MTDKTGPDSLPFEKIKLLFTGRVRNWKEVGGADLPVTIVLMKQPAALKLIEDKVLAGQKVRRGDGVKEAADADEMNKILSSTPGSIGFGPLAWSGPDLKFPKHEEIGRPITLFFRSEKEPAAKITKLLDFIRKRGGEFGIQK